MHNDLLVAGFKERFRQLKPLLEKDWQLRRQWAAAEALALRRGGRTIVSKVTGISRVTINAAMQELTSHEQKPAAVRRTVRAAPGRPRLTESDEHLLAALIQLMEPLGRRNRESPLCWTTRSTRRLANELTENNHPAVARSVAALLGRMGFTLEGRHKSRKPDADRDRAQQFRKVSDEVSRLVKRSSTVVVLNIKTRTTWRKLRQSGNRRQPPLGAEQGQLYERQQTALDKVLPGAAADILDSRLWTNAAIDQATARFAADSVRVWWTKLGRRRFKRKTVVVVVHVDQTGQRAELLEQALGQLAGAIGLKVRLLFLPPGTSRWESIAQRLFLVTTRLSRGQPEAIRQAIVTAIARKRTRAEPSVRAVLVGVDDK
jgi:hypothetical protein